MWDSGSTNIMIKGNQINHFKYKLRANKVNYSTAAGPYKTTPDVKVPFIMPYISKKKIVTHCFRVYKARGDYGIGYDMIILHDKIVQLGMKADFGRQIL